MQNVKIRRNLAGETGTHYSRHLIRFMSASDWINLKFLRQEFVILLNILKSKKVVYESKKVVTRREKTGSITELSKDNPRNWSQNCAKNTYPNVFYKL